MKKKPYIKKISDIEGFSIWYVNGYWIRKYLDKSFPNYGSRRTFTFIPKDEFWIDIENGAKESHYIIINFLAFQKALENDKSYEEAIEISTKVEKSERGKSKLLKRLKKIRIKGNLIKKIHKKQLFVKYTENLEIWLVRGNLVRSLFHVDFNQGGHEFVYPFVPKNEVWIDDSLYYKERVYVLIHELYERQLMIHGRKYDKVGLAINQRMKGDTKYAHPAAEDLEFWCRNHPKSIKRILLREIRENERLIKSEG